MENVERFHKYQIDISKYENSSGLKSLQIGKEIDTYLTLFHQT